jgi:hypothetical protein
MSSLDDRRRQATEHMREVLSKAKPQEARIIMAEAVSRGAISQREATLVDGKMNSETIHKISADISRRDDRE